MGIIEHGLGEGWVNEFGVDRVGRMDEDDGISFAELGPDGIEVLMAEIGVAIAITSEEGDPVSGEVVKGVSDFAEAGLGVEQGGKRGEKPVGSWVLLLERCAVLIAVTG